MLLSERDEILPFLPHDGIDRYLVQQQVFQELEGNAAIASRVEDIPRCIGGRRAVCILEETPLIILDLRSQRGSAIDHGTCRRSLPVDRFAEGVNPRFAETPDMAARRSLFVKDADRALDITVTASFSDEEIIISLPCEVRHIERIQIAGRCLADGQGQVLIFLGDIVIRAVGVAWAEIVQTAAGAAHLVQVKQHVRHPVLIHRHQIAAFGILGGEPVAVAVHPVVVGTGRGSHLVVFPRLGIDEVMGARIAVDPGRETAHSIGILGRDHDQNRIVQHSLHGRIFRSGIMVHQAQERLGTGNLVPVDRRAEVHDQRHPVQVERPGDCHVRHLQMLLPDLLQTLLVRRGSDADLQEPSALEGIAEAFDRHAVGSGGKIIHIAGDVAPVGQPFFEIEAQEYLGRLEGGIVLSISRLQRQDQGEQDQKATDLYHGDRYYRPAGHLGPVQRYKKKRHRATVKTPLPKSANNRPNRPMTRRCRWHRFCNFNARSFS